MGAHRFLLALIFAAIGFAGCTEYGAAQNDETVITIERWQGNPSWALTVTLNFKTLKGKILDADGNVDFNTGGAYVPPREFTSARVHNLANGEVEIELLFENSTSASLSGRFVSDKLFEGRYSDEVFGDFPVKLAKKN